MTPEEWDLRSMTEAQLKAKVLVEARARGWLVYHVQQGKIRSAGDHGYPDLTLARTGEVRWIELKREGAVLEPDQQRWMRNLPHLEVIRPADLDNGRLTLVLA